MASLMNRNLLIFDLDGTLADTRRDLTTAVNLTRARYGLPPMDADAVSACVGDGVRRLVERTLDGAVEVTDEVVGIYRDYYAAHMLDETALYPGVLQGLQALAEAGHVLAVLSNKPGDASRAILSHLGTDGLFARVIGGGDVPALKPAPDGIYELMRQCGAAAQDVWMIGDHHTDLEVARNAGVKSGFVSYGIGHPGEFTADQIWHGFDELTHCFLSERRGS